MTDAERALLLWVASKLAGLQFTDQTHEAPYVDGLMRKVREDERLQQEQWNMQARGYNGYTQTAGGLDNSTHNKRE